MFLSARGKINRLLLYLQIIYYNDDRVYCNIIASNKKVFINQKTITIQYLMLISSRREAGGKH